MLSIVIFLLPVAVSGLGIWILLETSVDDKGDNYEYNNKA